MCEEKEDRVRSRIKNICVSAIFSYLATSLCAGATLKVLLSVKWLMIQHPINCHAILFPRWLCSLPHLFPNGTVTSIELSGYSPVKLSLFPCMFNACTRITTDGTLHHMSTFFSCYHHCVACFIQMGFLLNITGSFEQCFYTLNILNIINQQWCRSIFNCHCCTRKECTNTVSCLF